ncbi:MAG: BamA/TamA family outer membrane protein, partial [Gemmatimonadales bacterium]
WARFDTPSGSVWRPIPRDRDQAFARFDGLAARVVRHYWPQLVEFESSYPSISGLTFAGRALDRRLLPVLEWHTWDSLVTAVQTRLTDQVLARAVEAIPPGHRELGGAEIAAFLHTRRDGLREAAREFYRLLAHQADVHATDHDEIATVTRLSEGDVRIEVRLAGAARPYLTRTYEKSDTHELRIYMHGGDDTVVLDGEVRTPIVLRIIGGGGSDRFLDLAAASNVGVTRFYDRGDRTQFDVKGPIDRSTWRPTGGADVIIPSSGSCNEGAIDTLPRDLVEPLRDWGNTIVGMPWLSYRTDVGLVVGGGFVYTRYGFRRSPYDYRLRVVGGVLTNDRDGFAETELRVPAGADGVAFNFLVRYSGVDFTRFHGLGNRTTSTREPDFYRVQQQLFEFLPSVRLRLDRSGAAQISIGASVKHQNTRSDSTTILGITQPYGLGGFGELGAVLSFDLDLRDHPVFPTRGLRLKGRATFYPRFWDVARRFGGFEGRAAMYLRARLPLQPVLALRAGGKWLWGRFPFHEAAYIGGSSTLRGFRRKR